MTADMTSPPASQPGGAAREDAGTERAAVTAAEPSANLCPSGAETGGDLSPLPAWVGEAFRAISLEQVELRADLERARSCAVALEQENARLQALAIGWWSR